MSQEIFRNKAKQDQAEASVLAYLDAKYDLATPKSQLRRLENTAMTSLEYLVDINCNRYSKHVDYQDYRQAARERIAHALNTFDLSKSNSFTYWAQMAIGAYVKLELNWSRREASVVSPSSDHLDNPGSDINTALNDRDRSLTSLAQVILKDNFKLLDQTEIDFLKKFLDTGFPAIAKHRVKTIEQLEIIVDKLKIYDNKFSFRTAEEVVEDQKKIEAFDKAQSDYLKKRYKKS